MLSGNCDVDIAANRPGVLHIVKVANRTNLTERLLFDKQEKRETKICVESSVKVLPIRQSLPSRKPAKRKAKPDVVHVDLDPPESFHKQASNVFTQTTNNDAQRASRYISMV